MPLPAPAFNVKGPEVAPPVPVLTTSAPLVVEPAPVAKVTLPLIVDDAAGVTRSMDPLVCPLPPERTKTSPPNSPRPSAALKVMVPPSADEDCADPAVMRTWPPSDPLPASILTSPTAEASLTPASKRMMPTGPASLLGVSNEIFPPLRGPLPDLTMISAPGFRKPDAPDVK